MPESRTPRATAVVPPGDLPERAPEGEPAGDEPTMLDVLGRVLDRGIVFEPGARAALPALDLAGGEGVATIAACEVPGTVGDATSAGWDALVAAAEAADAEAARRAATGAARPAAGDDADAWRSGEHAALRRQFERLDA